jgi:hypothetical protein
MQLRFLGPVKRKLQKLRRLKAICSPSCLTSQYSTFFDAICSASQGVLLTVLAREKLGVANLNIQKSTYFATDEMGKIYPGDLCGATKNAGLCRIFAGLSKKWAICSRFGVMICCWYYNCFKIFKIAG